RNLASRRNYYSVTRRDGTTDEQFESFLATEIEGPGIPIIRRLASTSAQLNWEDRGKLSALIAMQEVRVPWMREQYEHMMLRTGESFMYHALQIPGYLERTLKKMEASGTDLKGVTAEDLRSSVFGGKIKLSVGPEASIWAMGHAVPQIA